MRKIQQKAKVSENSRVGEKRYKIILGAAGIARISRPGQFVMVKVCGGSLPLLRRPLSISRAGNGRLEFLYEVKGEGTRMLSRVKRGEKLDIIGPLGNGFSYNPRIGSIKNHAGRFLSANRYPLTAILVAGGMGAAPLIFLAEKLREGKRKKEKGKILVLLGAKTKKELLGAREFRRLGCCVKISTDDGSLGFKGRVTDLLEQLLQAPNSKLRTPASQLPTIYACGPDAMLEAVSMIAAEYEIPAQVSMEQFMGCGLGACMGCVVKTKQGYKRACHDGPVFEAGEIIWE